ncbi:MAG TPA: DAK2 domain-containing protein [Solirubrobacteraceae bacterium]|nr:DAK2 domain-containing protein [Solirubrobacteraceae bacterium]
MTEAARAPAPDPSPDPPTGSDASLLRFRAVLEAGLGALEARREEINEINVFPVADGDTGDNMVLTLRSVLDELDRLAIAPPEGTIERVGRDEIVASVARAALLGARGNSGVILSQLLRGAAEELASRPGELVDPVLISAALARASDQAYGSVREPVEGTILTVVREMAAQVASETARMPDARLGADASAEEQNAAIARVIVRALQAGQSSVERGPELLPVLREAGVVDAGGYGLTVFIAGIVGGLAGAQPPVREHRARARVTHPQHSSSTYRYCASFAVTGTNLEQWRFAPALERLGDSLLIVGDQATLRVHIHTDDPDTVTAVFAPHGAVSHLDVADMREQLSERGDRIPAADPVVCGAVAVATGAGMQSLFESLGVRALDGGPSLTPSSYDMLAAIHQVAAEQVVVLPNSPNALEAARRAAQLSDKTVCVVPSLSPQAGLAAAVALDPTSNSGQNAASMTRALEHVRTGAVAPATLDDAQGRFRAGDAVGFVEEEIVAWGRPREALREVLEQLAHDAELITCLRGAEAPLDDGIVQALAQGDVEFELSDGGQQAQWWLLAAE